MHPGTACAPVPHDPPRRLSDIERALVSQALSRQFDSSELEILMDEAKVVEDCAGCATFYCRPDSRWIRHDMRGALRGGDADGMEIDCLVFVDAEGIWGADVYRADGEPWKAMPDPSTFEPWEP